MVTTMNESEPTTGPIEVRHIGTQQVELIRINLSFGNLFSLAFRGMLAIVLAGFAWAAIPWILYFAFANAQ